VNVMQPGKAHITVKYTDMTIVEFHLEANTFIEASARATVLADEELDYNHSPGVRIVTLVLEWTPV